MPSLPSALRGRPPAPARLARLLEDLFVLEVHGDPQGVEITGVTADSRSAGPGTLFCCIRGTVTDGHDHAAAAVASGAVAVMCDRLLDLPRPAVQLVVADPRVALAVAAASFFGHPSRSLRVAGITGTNGKTTTTYLLRSVLEAHGWSTGVIGTIGAERTTPEAPVLQARLAAELEGGRRAVAIEVSSHGLSQHRTDAVHFAAVAFTNLTQDHLDYHGDMESYFATKASLFDPGRAEVGVVNADDPYGQRLLQRGGLRLVPYRLADAAQLSVDPATAASSFTWEGQPVHLSLGGPFNLANALCAATIARELGVPPPSVAAGLSSAAPVPGRFERVDAGQPFTIVVDYAHTPDALEQLLTTARHMTEATGPRGRLVVVFGCGGGRDRAKRPLMGEVAARLADTAVLTSDNPRHEDPIAIIEDVRSGVGAAFEPALLVQPDRRTAIEEAVAGARPGDVVVVAGKGHETGQTIGDETLPFDDREVARDAAADWAAP
ncbi:MAG TPA: UDP-N-acetylmuramoyl-L-alanyl-D-glutamate--2,6-diaminopimelate ligase [Acidimicrobiales bacterium]|nr:UDP-N-acetylmuramoyl-L-alanyl-D-glutamate--2,6-diaminopimelate ligase [Acidimicrobiales bacterium]